MNQLNRQKSKPSYLSSLMKHDRYTYEHSIRVADLLYEFSLYTGIPSKHAFYLYEVGVLHDIGKLTIPQYILKKTEPLTNAELDIIKQHPLNGLKLLLHHDIPNNYLECIAYHHENIDGSGYPYGMKGDSIPLFSRMLRIVDSYDAMNSERTYSTSITKREALNELKDGKGTFYEPLLVDWFIEMMLKR